MCWKTLLFSMVSFSIRMHLAAETLSWKMELPDRVPQTYNSQIHRGRSLLRSVNQSADLRLEACFSWNGSLHVHRLDNDNNRLELRIDPQIPYCIQARITLFSVNNSILFSKEVRCGKEKHATLPNITTSNLDSNECFIPTVEVLCCWSLPRHPPSNCKLSREGQLYCFSTVGNTESPRNEVSIQKEVWVILGACVAVIAITTGLFLTRHKCCPQYSDTTKCRWCPLLCIYRSVPTQDSAGLDMDPRVILLMYPSMTIQSLATELLCKLFLDLDIKASIVKISDGKCNHNATTFSHLVVLVTPQLELFSNDIDDSVQRCEYYAPSEMRTLFQFSAENHKVIHLVNLLYASYTQGKIMRQFLKEFCTNDNIYEYYLSKKCKQYTVDENLVEVQIQNLVRRILGAKHLCEPQMQLIKQFVTKTGDKTFLDCGQKIVAKTNYEDNVRNILLNINGYGH